MEGAVSPETREFTVLIRGRVRVDQGGQRVTVRKLRRQVTESVIRDPGPHVDFDGDVEVIIKR